MNWYILNFFCVPCNLEGGHHASGQTSKCIALYGSSYSTRASFNRHRVSAKVNASSCKTNLCSKVEETLDCLKKLVFFAQVKFRFRDCQPTPFVLSLIFAPSVQKYANTHAVIVLLRNLSGQLVPLSTLTDLLSGKLQGESISSAAQKHTRIRLETPSQDGLRCGKFWILSVVSSCWWGHEACFTLGGQMPKKLYAFWISSAAGFLSSSCILEGIGVRTCRDRNKSGGHGEESVEELWQAACPFEKMGRMDFFSPFLGFDAMEIRTKEGRSRKKKCRSPFWTSFHFQ